MAATDPRHEGISPADIQDERFIAALCRSARLSNEQIHKKREETRAEIRRLQRDSDELEGRYWNGYQKRLAEVIERNPQWHNTRRWISHFGTSEKAIAETVQKRQGHLREQARLREQELRELDGEFWGSWRTHVDAMIGISPSQAPSSSNTPSTTVPAGQHQPTDGQTHSALPTPSTGHFSQGESSMLLQDGKNQALHSSGQPAVQPLPKNWDVIMNTTDSQAQGLQQDSSGLADASTPAASGISVPAAPAHFPPAMPPVPNPLPTEDKEQHQSLSSTAGAAPGNQDQGGESHSKALMPQSFPTPKSTFTSINSRSNSSQDTANNMQQPIVPPKAMPAKSSATVKDATQESQSQMMAATTNVTAVSNSPIVSTPTVSQDQGDLFAGVTDPVPGEIYQAYYQDSRCKGWWMCTVLPWDSWEREIGIRYDMQKAGMFRDMPPCYTADTVRAKPNTKHRRMKHVITGWSPGFEAGGPRERERVFPVLLFDDTPGEAANFSFPPADRPFTFSKKAERALPAEWVAAANLRHAGSDVGGGGGGGGARVEGHETAARFRERVVALRRIQAKKRMSTPSGKPKGSSGPSTPVGSSSPSDGSPLADSSPLAVAGASSPVDANTKDDVEMADAESLSGATAVDDAAGQPEFLNVDMTDPASKSPPKS
ncbi:hypothetical protein diail_12079 [Diaporthe ilicicola]|nr:hypothetical protein diail_12079 [Diaporthe ilicicola]